MVDVEVSEIAVIFEPIMDKEGFIKFYPVSVNEGYYDEEYEKFIDENLYTYDHFVDFPEGKSYALRANIATLYKNNPDKTLNEIKEDILNKLRQYNYFIEYYEEQGLLIQEDPETERLTIVLDDDTFDRCSFLFDTMEDIKEYEDKLNGIEVKENKKEENDNKTESSSNNTVKISPHKLYKEIRKTIIGQDEAIKQVVTTIWENYYGDTTSNMIILGPSGSGKTEIIRQVAKLLDIPLLLTSVTGMSQAGYVGRGTDEILKDLLTLTNGDVKKAEHAIVVLDEFDKIAYSGYNSGSISTDGVQNELLKIVEDGTFGIDYSMGERKVINTAHITFIGVGACTSLLTKKVSKQMGFNCDINAKEEKITKVNPEDLIEKLGLKAELVGRMGKIIKLNELSLETFAKIITDSKKSVYRDKINLINKNNIKYFEDNHEEVINAIATLALDKKIGARALTSIINEMFSDIMFNLSDEDENYSELIVSKETVTNPKKYILRK